MKAQNSTFSAISPLLKRARSKYFTHQLVLKLVSLDSSLKKNYWNTYHCSSILIKTDDKISSSSYCKNRWCLLCNRIRTAINIKKYSGELKSWHSTERQFVTLTIPNVPKEDLSNAISLMFKNFARISDVMKRNQKKPLVGLRKLECTYNPDRDDYHPHFHCIIRGEDEANTLLNEWLKRYPKAERWCQDVRQGNDNDVMELFKYFTKIISSKSTNRNQHQHSTKQRIYIEALDTIFLAVRSRRTFQSFGFKAAKIDEDDFDTVDEKLLEQVEYYVWEKEITDWINVDTGDYLTNYTPSDGLKRLLEKAE